MSHNHEESFPQARHWETSYVNYREENLALIEKWEAASDLPLNSAEGFFQAGLDKNVRDKINGICPPEHIARLRASIAASSGGSGGSGGSGVDNIDSVDTDDPIPTEPVAWVEDISYHENDDGGTCTKLPAYGPLSPAGLFALLRKPRYHIPGEESKDHANQDSDANIRFIAVTNLDNWTIPALVATASTSQAHFLKDFLLRAVGSQARFAYSFYGNNPSRDLRTFAIEIQIPFCVLRTRAEAKEDTRKWSHHAGPIRQTKKIAFVSPENACKEGLSDALHEGKAACLITGQNRYNWTCHQNVDTYFDNYDESDDSIPRFNVEDTGTFQGDTPTCGIDISHYDLGPREYALHWIAGRLHAVANEKTSICEFLRKNIHAHVDSQHLVGPAGDPAAWRTMDQRSQDLKQTSMSIAEASSTILRVHNIIALNISSWESFRADQLPGLRVGVNPDFFGVKCNQIQNALATLNDIKESLRGLMEMCHNSDGSLDRFRLVRENKAIDVQHLSSTRLDFFNPVAIAANLLQANIVTMKPTAASFAIITVSLWILNLVFEPALKFGSHLVDFISRLLRPPCPQAAARAEKEAAEAAAKGTSSQDISATSFGSTDNDMFKPSRSFTLLSSFSRRRGARTNTMDSSDAYYLDIV